MQTYNLGTWLFAPIAVGIIVSASAVVLQRRGEEAQQKMPAYSRHLRLLFWSVVFFYLLAILGGLSYGFMTTDAAQEAGAANLDSGQVIALETIFGPFRNALCEGSATTVASVAGIVFLINVLGILISYVLPGFFLVPGFLLLLYVGWTQGRSLAEWDASTLGSMLGFSWMLALESFSYVLGTVAGMNFSLALLVRSWTGRDTRGAALRAAGCTALKLFGLILAILFIQALSETLYVRQVLLHGGSGIPLMPY
ncbi:MAG: hypothetical protein K1Y02_08640 [Candidatus Hydrogenedentes bacterium]|nr:hypothetical protein [Candidatus Hydrogenedentota bacterium]